MKKYVITGLLIWIPLVITIWVLKLVVETLDGLAMNGEAGNGDVEASVKARVSALTKRFPIY